LFKLEFTLATMSMSIDNMCSLLNDAGFMFDPSMWRCKGFIVRRTIYMTVASDTVIFAKQVPLEALDADEALVPMPVAAVSEHKYGYTRYKEAIAYYVFCKHHDVSCAEVSLQTVIIDHSIMAGPGGQVRVSTSLRVVGLRQVVNEPAGPWIRNVRRRFH
jgi:hypothetical protein